MRKDDKRGSNRKGTDDVLTDGSVVHVYPNMMILSMVAKSSITLLKKAIIQSKNDSAPSMFNGSLKDAIAETFSRFKFGGVTPQNNKFLY